MVAEIEEMEVEFICISIFAKLVLLAPVGDLSRPLPELEVTAGGRLETQSWTSRLTCGFVRRFCVFLEEGLEVIIIVGPEGS